MNSLPDFMLSQSIQTKDCTQVTITKTQKITKTLVTFIKKTEQLSTILKIRNLNFKLNQLFIPMFKELILMKLKDFRTP